MDAILLLALVLGMFVGVPLLLPKIVIWLSKESTAVELVEPRIVRSLSQRIFLAASAVFIWFVLGFVVLFVTAKTLIALFPENLLGPIALFYGPWILGGIAIVKAINAFTQR